MHSETIQVACPACLTANRVPAGRAGEDPKCGKLAARMGIRAIPTLALFRNGAEVKRASGAMDAGSLVRWAQL